MSLSFAAIQAALSAWVVAASGLDAEDVVWAYAKYQGGPRPVGTPFISLRLGPTVEIGNESLMSTTDLTRARGQEVQLETQSQHRVTVRLQCFGGLPDGDHSALAILTRVRNRLVLPAIRSPLHVAGLAPFDPGAVMDVSFIEGTKFESRAVCDVGFYVALSESEYVGFIEWVTGQGTYYGGGAGTFIGTFDVDARE